MAPEQLDLWRFERWSRRATGRWAQDRGGRRSLREALALWRGPPLADFSYAPFAQAAIVRLEELRLAAIELRIEAELAPATSAPGRRAQALVREHPLRERLCGQLMLALYRDGRQAEALEAYRARAAGWSRRSASSRGRSCASSSGAYSPRTRACWRPTAAAAPARAILVLAGQEATLDPLVGWRPTSRLEPARSW